MLILKEAPGWRNRVLIGLAAGVGLIAWLPASGRAAGEYPLTLTLDASAKTAAVTVTSRVTVSVERLMEEARRKRVTDALMHGGFANFLTALRALPPIGTIELAGRKVEIRYAREEEGTSGRRLLVIADRPLFFLGDPAKSRAGYEMTVLDLRFDPGGGVTGTMAGAARVKPSPDGVVLDDYAEVLAHLEGHSPNP